MSFKIPNNGQIRQLGYGDIAGELWSSFNIDIHTSPGKIQLARPLKQVASDTDLGSGAIVGFGMLDGDPYALTDTTLYKTTTASSFETWSSANSGPANADDMVSFRGQLVMTTNNNIDAFDSSSFTQDWWTARGNPTLTNNNPTVVYPHMMEVLRIGSETLAVTDGYQVHAYTGAIGSGSGTSVTVDLPQEYVATCIKSAIRKAWIGTYSMSGGEAMVFEWDGASTNYTQAYPTGARAVLAMELIEDTPVIVTERGEVKIFNGAGFSTRARLPFSTKALFADGVSTSNINANSLTRPVHPKGMKRAGDKVLIFVAHQTNDRPLDERSPNGLWALDISNPGAPDWSLTHLASPDNEQAFINSSPIMVIDDAFGRIFVGGKKTDNTVGIWLEDLGTTAHYGYYTTTELGSKNITDTFERMVIKAVTGTGEIVGKYRTSTEVEYPVVASVAWSSTTTFGTTADLSLVEERYNAGHRDEIEVITGAGAGRLAHITSLDKSASTYTITVDQAIGTAGSTATLRIDNWKLIDKTMDSSTEVERFGTSGEASSVAQFKIELRGAEGVPTIRETGITTTIKEQ